LCAAARIIERGAAQYLRAGTTTSPGTKLLSVSGDCRLPGIYEVEWGIRVREVLDKCEADRPHLIQVSGPSGECISMDEADRAIALDDLSCSGSFMIFSRQRDLLDILRNYTRFFKLESCGLARPVAQVISSSKRSWTCSRRNWRARPISTKCCHGGGS
jgi:[NiFe] hydrogenase diaphorase moiety large subunit